MKRITLTTAVLLPLLALGACGRTTGDRAVSGAGIGAGAGALTSPGQINLGRPIWR
ncbi:MAG: hypothetical protein J0H91_03835 [Rhodospirillales bacterium]|nr:hypothetical protein [Rhodospirillales bacterium]